MAMKMFSTATCFKTYLTFYDAKNFVYPLYFWKNADIIKMLMLAKNYIFT